VDTHENVVALLDVLEGGEVRRPNAQLDLEQGSRRTGPGHATPQRDFKGGRRLREGASKGRFLFLSLGVCLF
jgi:hypothetical protein